MEFVIVLDKKAEKFLGRCDQMVYSRLIRKIEELRNNPYPSGVKSIKGELRVFRIRMGDYRIIYEILKESNEIFIIDINKRSVVYRLRDEDVE